MNFSSSIFIVKFRDLLDDTFNTLILIRYSRVPTLVRPPYVPLVWDEPKTRLSKRREIGKEERRKRKKDEGLESIRNGENPKIMVYK